VAALMAVYGRGEIRIQRIAVRKPVAPNAPASVAPTPLSVPVLPSEEAAKLERSRV
jgi:hypothetical protein